MPTHQLSVLTNISFWTGKKLLSVEETKVKTVLSNPLKSIVDLKANRCPRIMFIYSPKSEPWEKKPSEVWEKF